VAKHQVKIGGFEGGQESISRLRIVYDAEVHYLDFAASDPFDKDIQFLPEFIEKPIELGPVLVKSDPEYSDVGRSLLSSRHFHVIYPLFLLNSVFRKADSGGLGKQRLAAAPTTMVGNIANAPNHHVGISVQIRTNKKHVTPAATPMRTPVKFALRVNIPSR